MEPCENEQELHLVGILGAISRGNILERSKQVVLHTRWCLVGDFETRLEKDARELLMRFTSKPETEARVRRQHLELLLEDGEPWRHQVKVLQTDPFTFLCSLLDRLNCNFALATAHGELVVGSTADRLLRVGLKLLRGVRAWRNDEQNWLRSHRL